MASEEEDDTFDVLAHSSIRHMKIKGFSRQDDQELIYEVFIWT